MRKLAILILLFTVFLASCVPAAPAEEEVVNDPLTESGMDITEVVDQLAIYKEQYDTDLVFVDSLNPLSYVVITKDELITILKTADLEKVTSVKFDQISSVEVLNVQEQYCIITIKLVGNPIDISICASPNNTKLVLEKINK